MTKGILDPKKRGNSNRPLILICTDAVLINCCKLNQLELEELETLSKQNCYFVLPAKNGMRAKFVGVWN